MEVIIEKVNSIGKAFFDFSLPMLIQSGILVIFLLIIDFFLRKKVRAVFRYFFWMLVLIKLVLPPSVTSPVGIGNFTGGWLENTKLFETEKMPAENPTMLVPEIQKPKPELYKEIEPWGADIRSLEYKQQQSEIVFKEQQIPQANQQTPVKQIVSINWQGSVFIGWLIIVVVMALLLVQRFFFVRGLVRQSELITGGINDLLQSCCGQLGIKRKITVRQSANAASPAVCGLFRLVILLPENLIERLDRLKMKAILLHELTHIRRHDLWVNLAQTLLQIIYFYNPFVWMANAIIRRVREQAVDEAVQVALGESAQSYPQILVDVAKIAFRKPSLGLRLIGVVESKSALKIRIARMLSRPIPKSAKLGIAGLAAIVLIGFVLLPMAAAKVGEPEFVIKGTVTDAQTGKPIAGAKIYDNGYGPGPDWKNVKPGVQAKFGAITDSNGQYRYITWYEEHGLKCDANDYNSQKTGFGTKIFGTEKTKVINFALEKINKTGVQIESEKSAGQGKQAGNEEYKIIGFIKTDSNDVGTITAIYGSTIYGNNIRYTPSLYLGRIERYGKIELIDPNVILNQFGTPIIKIKTVTENPTVPADSIGWVQLSETSFTDRFIDNKNVSLVPGQKTNVQIEVEKSSATENTEHTEKNKSAGQDEDKSDAVANSAFYTTPVTRKIYDTSNMKDCFIDFDKDKIYSIPEGFYTLPDSEQQKWMIDNGIDAAGETTEGHEGLWGEQIFILPLSNDAFDRDTPGSFRGLEKSKPSTPSVMTAIGDLPKTYFFKTKEGGLGLLQILEVRRQQEPHWLQIRYKMVPKTAEVESRIISNENLNELGRVIGLFSYKNNGLLPDRIEDFGSSPKDPNLIRWLTDNVQYLGKGKTDRDRPDSVIAYDKVLLKYGKGTNVLFLDFHVEYCWPQRLKLIGTKEGINFDEWTEGEKGIRVYQVNRSVAEFPKEEDFSTPQSAYASINRVSASSDVNGWQKVSVKRLAEKLAAEQARGKQTVDSEWAKVLVNTKIIEVRIWKGKKAAVFAELPAQFSSKPITKPIDVRMLEFEDSRWLNAGNDRTWTIDEARAKFAAAVETYKQDELKIPAGHPEKK